MSQTKNQYADQIPGPYLTESEISGLEAAEEEYYAEQRRHAVNKAKLDSLPVEAPREPRYEGRRTFLADPATDTKRFEQVCREADKEAAQKGTAVVVFKNREDNYFTWEEKYISRANAITALYTAQPK